MCHYSSKFSLFWVRKLCDSVFRVARSGIRMGVAILGTEAFSWLLFMHFDKSHAFQSCS